MIFKMKRKKIKSKSSLNMKKYVIIYFRNNPNIGK